MGLVLEVRPRQQEPLQGPAAGGLHHAVDSLRRVAARRGAPGGEGLGPLVDTFGARPAAAQGTSLAAAADVSVRIYAQNGRIIVDGADGEVVRIYDITGRSVLNNCLHAGVYLVIVGDRTTKKVVVMSDSY